MKKIPQYKPNLVEEEMLKIWKKEGTFQASLEKTKNGEPIVSMTVRRLPMACRISGTAWYKASKTLLGATRQCKGAV